MALYANVERFFLDAIKNQKERETFLGEPVSSLKLVCNLKHLSCKHFHKIGKRRFCIFGKFKKSAKYPWAK